MPLEIRELIIKATVGETKDTQGAAGGDNAGVKAQEAIIRQCVEQVMAILKDKQER